MVVTESEAYAQSEIGEVTVIFSSRTVTALETVQPFNHESVTNKPSLKCRCTPSEEAFNMGFFTKTRLKMLLQKTALLQLFFHMVLGTLGMSLITSI